MSLFLTLNIFHTLIWFEFVDFEKINADCDVVLIVREVMPKCTFQC